MNAIRYPDPIIGPDDQPYWDYVSQGELRLQCCSTCDHLRYPPAPVCPRCLSSGHEWKPLSGRGVVGAWTVFHRTYFPDLPAPYVVVSVETEEGPLLVGNFVSDGGAKPVIGLPVEAFFEEVEFASSSGRHCQWKPRD